MPNLFRPKSNISSRVSLALAGLVPVLALGIGSLVSRSSANTSQNVPINQPVPFSHKHHAIELGIDCEFCHVGVTKSAKAGVPATEVCMSCHSVIWTNSPILEPVRKSYAEGTPIVWAKVNKLPEFVYFDHSIHIARGINCNSCHGPVQDMHITWKGHVFSMAWCLECHREPEKYLRDQAPGKNLSPQNQVFEIYKKIQAGEELDPRQAQLAAGNARLSDPADIKAGEELLEKYKVNKKQLMDCWVCHR